MRVEVASNAPLTPKSRHILGIKIEAEVRRRKMIILCAVKAKLDTEKKRGYTKK